MGVVLGLVWGIIPAVVGLIPEGPQAVPAVSSAGGSWDRSAGYLRSAYRYSDDPTNSRGNLGFRPVRRT